MQKLPHWVLFRLIRQISGGAWHHPFLMEALCNKRHKVVFFG
jgi:hypothetical protein